MRAQPVRWIAVLTMCLPACGARTELEVLNTDASVSFDPGTDAHLDTNVDAHPDAQQDAQTEGKADAPIATCKMAWQYCKPLFEPLLVSGADVGGGEWSDVAFDGSHFLVTYYNGTVHVLARVDITGHILWNEEVGDPLGGGTFPRVTWNPALGVGLTGSDFGFRWLGADGKAVGAFVHTGVGGDVDICATSSGFLALSSQGSSNVPPGLLAAVVGPLPTTAVPWQYLTQDTQRGTAEHVNGPDGLAQYAVSVAYEGAIGDLWELKVDALPKMIQSIASIPPLDYRGYTQGLAEQGGHVYLLRGAESTDVSNQQISEWVVDLTSGTSKQISTSLKSSGHMLKLGDQMLVAVDGVVAPDAVSVALYDPVDGVVQGPVALGSSPYGSSSPRMINSSRGYAVAWSEHTYDNGDSIYLQAFDCCQASE